MLVVNQLSGFGADVGTGNDQHTQLLLHCDGADTGTTFTDSSKNAFTATPTTTTTSVTQSKFGGTSGYFGASRAARVVVADNSVLRAQSSFSIDFWAYLTDVTTNQYLFSKINLATGLGPYAINVVSGTAKYSSSSADVSFDIANGVSMGSVTANTWYHYALSWDGSTWRPFINGVLGTTTSSGTTPMNTVGKDLAVGNYQYDATASLGAIGYMDEVRYSSVARWTSAFTPPITQYI